MITGNAVEIKSLEKIIFDMACQAGREMLATVLGRLDDKLMVERGRSVFRNKGKRKTVLKTVMGEGEYQRTCHAPQKCSAWQK